MTNILVLCGILFAAVGPSEGKSYLEGLKEAEEAFPGLHSFLAFPPAILKVKFENGAELNFGKNITPTESINQPAVTWDASPDSYYTLCIVDPDPPSRDDPYMSEIVSWLVGNIHGNDIAKADTLVEYIGAGPPRNMGMNRYFYFLFKQNGKLDFSNVKRIDKFTAYERTNFSIKDYAKKYDLEGPVAFNFLTAYFDEQVNKLYGQLHCCEDLM